MTVSRSYWIRDSNGMAHTLLTTPLGARRTFVSPVLATRYFGMEVTREQAAHALRTARKNGADIGRSSTSL